MRDFKELAVSRLVKRLSGQAMTVELEVPAHLKEAFRWQAGQHVSIEVEIDGESCRRSYSISDSPHNDPPLEFTVKRVANGVVSNYLNDHLEVRQTLKVLPPFGSFLLRPQPKHQRTHYFIAAGSGSTPIYSMLRSALELEPYSQCHLLLGNREQSSVLLADRLELLEQHHPKRLSIHHVWSKPTWSSTGYWRTGRLDTAALEAFMNECPPYAQDTQFYVCGPGSMNTDIVSALLNLDVPTERIHRESYGSAASTQKPVSGVDSSVEIRLGDQVHEFNAEKSETVLQAARKAGLKPPYSCESGVCGACKAKLLSGRVHMKARMALDDSEIQAGQVLTCQAVAQTPDLTLAYL
jgi:ring-1,2-phenylacetyl-CoA epoxidase subunit PaaE